MKGWMMVAPTGIETDEALTVWLKKAREPRKRANWKSIFYPNGEPSLRLAAGRVQFAQTLPPK